MESQLLDQVELLFQSVQDLAEGQCDKARINALLEQAEFYESQIFQFSLRSDERHVILAKLTMIKKQLLVLAKVVNGSILKVVDVTPSDLKIEKKLGEGQYGVVYKATLANTQVAVKTVKTSLKDREAFIEEAQLMSMMSHPNILRLMCAIHSPTTNEILIVSELCDTDLYTISRDPVQRKDPLFMKRAIRWFAQAAMGLSWMHKVCHMVHRDIKPANLLVKNGDCLVADFGFTSHLENQDGTLIDEKSRGSPYYMAPELLRCQPFNFSVDCYALAVSIFDFLLGNFPYDSTITNRLQLTNAVSRGQRPDFSRMRLPILPSLKSLMEECWAGVPSARPSMPSIAERLKDIYIESYVSRSNPAFGFWQEHFRNEIKDTVPVKQAVGCLPGKAAEHILGQIADKDGNVKLSSIRFLSHWYGNWATENNLRIIDEAFRNNPWFVGYCEATTAEFYLQHELNNNVNLGGSFLVRCSMTKIEAPYTITMIRRGETPVHHRIEKTPDGNLVCPSLGCVGSEGDKDIFVLMRKLYGRGLLSGKPYSGRSGVLSY